MTQPLWACLRLPALAMDSVLRQRSAEQQHQPLALLCGPAQRRVLAAINEPARAAGLHAGQAQAVAEAICPALASEALDPRHAEHSRELLAAWGYQYSSQVSIAAFDDALLLEVGASLGLFGPWPRLAERLCNGLKKLGFHHHLVLTPNPHAAHALAARHEQLAVTTTETLDQVLAELPVTCAGFEPRHAERLARMGLDRLGKLSALPRTALAKRFGRDLLAQIDTLRSTRPAALPLWQPPPRFTADIEFQQAVNGTGALLFPLQRLCTDLATFLLARDGGVQHFELSLPHEDHAPSRLAVGLLAPEREAGRLFELARQRLERMRLPAPVIGISIEAAKLPDFVPERADLFTQRADQALSWPQLRERLRARLGDDAVRSIAAQPDHRPERAWHNSDTPSGQAADTPRLPRPTWLLARPIPLRGPPPRILAGPERIESGWWDGGDTRRDYYVVETTQGQRAWVFCALGERGPFHLQGWFA